MSYYTILKPDWSLHDMDRAQLEKAAKDNDDEMAKAWNEIWVSAFNGHTGSLREYVDNYLAASESRYDAEMRLMFMDDDEHEIYFNNFPYNDNPETGYVETQLELEKLLMRLVAYVTCDKRALAYSALDTQDDVVMYLDEIFGGIRERIDELMRTHCFCELAIKYWDTHECG